MEVLGSSPCDAAAAVIIQIVIVVEIVAVVVVFVGMLFDGQASVVQRQGSEEGPRGVKHPREAVEGLPHLGMGGAEVVFLGRQSLCAGEGRWGRGGVEVRGWGWRGGEVGVEGEETRVVC